MSVELEGDISTSTNSFIRNERTVAEEEFEQQIRVKKGPFQKYQTKNTVQRARGRNLKTIKRLILDEAA